MKQPMFDTLVQLLSEPLRLDRGVKTDNSILLIYPPERELDFREQLLDELFPVLDAHRIQSQRVDLTGFMFRGLEEPEIQAIQNGEFDDYGWTIEGLSRRTSASLKAYFEDLSSQYANGNVVLYGTISLYPLVRFGDLLRDIRDLPLRIVLGFPGDERGGKLHFMKEPDGGNYLAVKLLWV